MTAGAFSPSQLRALASTIGLSQCVDSLERLAEWGFRLQSINGADPDGSKIGGYPSLPSDSPWPNAEGARSVFAAQIAIDDLPGAGFGLRSGLEQGTMLSFFVFQDRSTREVVGGRVLVTTRQEALEPRRPDAVTHDTIHPERSAVPRPELTLPPWGRGVRDALDVGLEAREPYVRLLAALEQSQYPDIPRHRLLGHPDRIIDDVLEEAAVLESMALGSPDGDFVGVARRTLTLRLLLMLDADAEAGILWPDGGAAYFCIDAVDLEQGRYDRVQAFTQSQAGGS